MRLGVEPALGQGAVAGGIDELLELRVGHLVTVDPEAVDAHHMGEALLGLMALRTHLEAAAGDERHAGGFAVLNGETGVGGAAPDRGFGRVSRCDAGREGGNHCASQNRAEPEGSHQQAASYHDQGPLYWNAKMRFQSFYLWTRRVCGADAGGAGEMANVSQTFQPSGRCSAPNSL